MRILKYALAVWMVMVSAVVWAQIPYPVIPYPNKLIPEKGEFEFKSKITVTFPSAFKEEKRVLSALFAEEYAVKFVSSSDGKIEIKVNKDLDNEAYKLNVTPDKIVIEAGTGSGCFWAFQTLRHLMRLTGKGSYVIAACQIDDKPNYSWRAFMLDEARHFKGKAVVKQMLDQMALLKLNVFHWHLTDDQGWRIEIKKYPLLTEIGAWRDSTQIEGWKSNRFDPFAHGGFYTQDDIKEIVDYAAKRHIRIVPEIEMPGHAAAAIAAYPWLGCDGVALKSPTRFGGGKVVAYNVADERVVGFLEDVLKEVMSLFPGNVIHIGGDEVNFGPWAKSEVVKTWMEKKNLTNYSDVQLNFTNHISNYIDKNGRRMMGWNEIMGKNVHEWSDADHATGSLSSNSIVHFWKGDTKLLLEAVEKGHDVINSTHSYTYLDYNYDGIPLEKAYKFQPTPKGITEDKKKHVLGLGCQMWCEWIPTVYSMHQRVFPRIAAYAEVGWTQEENKDYTRFRRSLRYLKKYWNSKNINYHEEVEILNEGIGGNASGDILARMKNKVLLEKPDVVVLMAGTNDVLNDKNIVSYSKYSANIDSIVTFLSRERIHVVLVSPPPADTVYLFQRHDKRKYPQPPNVMLDSISKILQAKAVEYNVGFVDIYKTFTEMNVPNHNQDDIIRNVANCGKADGVHPTKNGYKIIADKIIVVLKAKCRVKKGTKIICFGDSITYGVHVNGAGTITGDTYPAYLNKYYNLPK